MRKLRNWNDRFEIKDLTIDQRNYLVNYNF